MRRIFQTGSRVPFPVIGRIGTLWGSLALAALLAAPAIRAGTGVEDAGTVQAWEVEVEIQSETAFNLPGGTEHVLCPEVKVGLTDWLEVGGEYGYQTHPSAEWGEPEVAAKAALLRKGSFLLGLPLAAEGAAVIGQREFGAKLTTCREFGPVKASFSTGADFVREAGRTEWEAEPGGKGGIEYPVTGTVSMKAEAEYAEGTTLLSSGFELDFPGACKVGLAGGGARVGGDWYFLLRIGTEFEL